MNIKMYRYPKPDNRKLHNTDSIYRTLINQRVKILNNLVNDTVEFLESEISVDEANDDNYTFLYLIKLVNNNSEFVHDSIIDDCCLAMNTYTKCLMGLGIVEHYTPFKWRVNNYDNSEYIEILGYVDFDCDWWKENA